MNKTLKITGITTGVFLLATAGASAATVTVGAHSPQDSTNTANVYGAGYGAYTNGGASWDKDVTWTASAPDGSEDGISKSPFKNTHLAATRDYFSVIYSGAPGAGGGGASPATLTFGKTQTAFNMLWGSIDSYNEIEFFLGGTSQGAATTGADIVGIAGSGGTAPNFEEVALVKFSDLSFDSVKFTSDGSNSFEFALAPVPLPAAGWLMIAGLGGLAAMRRRKKSA